MARRTSAARRRANQSTPTRLARLRAGLGEWLRLPLRQSGMHLATLVLAVLTLSLMVHFINQVLQSANLEEQRAELAHEVAALDAQNDHLRSAIDFVESDVYVEQVAREQLGYAREGDVVVLPNFPDTQPAAEPEAPLAAPPPRPAAPNWQRWWEAFVIDEQPPARSDEKR
jgi:cell division protein FtsB